jgi:deoxycytidylate deaminase
VYDACPAIHAEANALLYVDRSQVEGGTLYVTSAVCMQCAKLVSNSGVARVVMVVRGSDTHRNPHEVVAYLEKCGMRVSAVPERDSDG